MNTTTKKLLKACTITTEIGESRYATRQPQITLRAPKGTHYRQVKAAILALAAEAELATPVNEHWIPQVDNAGDEFGYVYLEVSDGDEAEAKRGLALLGRIAR